MILAQSATRNIGVVILAVVIIGFLVYLFFNLLETRGEGGSEIELAANRKPYFNDDILETTKLDQSLLSGLFLLSVIGLALPLYWLGEPGRHEGLVDNTIELWTEDGAESYEENCSSCHGGGGAGGIASFAITEQGTGAFVASVDWVAPSLTSVLTRFTEEEVIYILNFGRNGVMPAWGGPGGGPLTSQQLEVLVVYMRSIQKDVDAVQVAVTDGLIAGARDEWVSRDPDLSARLLAAQQNLARQQQTGVSDFIEAAQGELSELQREIGETFPNDQMAAWVDEISDPNHEEYLTYGKLIFINEADSGAYNCARCHTAGWSYSGASDLDISGNPVTTITLDDGTDVPGYLQGGGWFGPNLTNGAEVTQFPNPDSHIDFIRKGSEDGIRYGVAGQGSGQMPGFSNRLDSDLTEEIEIDGVVMEVEKSWPASLTEDQIAAVVAYARSL
jgi:mono/diheme cytochrome c family protein